mgnify:CR=1 FL=1
MVTLVCVATAALVALYGWMWRLDGLFYDAALSLRRQAPDSDIVIVAVDDRSLAEIGRWPWDRAVHALLIETLTEAGARVIAFDIMLHEASRERPQGDAVLAEAIARHGRVVLPVTHTAYGVHGDDEGLPARVFAEAAAALGHIHIELDPDGIARSVYLWEGMGNAHHPQFALAALELADASRAQAYARVEDADRVEMAPAVGSGWWRADWLRIPFIGPPGTYPYIPYVDVLRGEVPPATLAGAVVFVGSSAAGLGDIVPTPTSGHSRLMPGVEVHATIFESLRRGDWIRVVPAAWVAGVWSALVFGLLLLLLRSSPRIALLATFGSISLILAGSMLLLFWANIWWPPAGAVLACLLAYPLWSWRRLESAQHYLDAELAALSEVGARFAMSSSSATAGPDAAADRFAARIARVREAALQQRILQRFIADTLDGLPVGAVVLAPDGEVRLCNRRAFELLGVAQPWAVRATLGAMPWPGDELPCSGTATSWNETLQIEAELAEGRIVLASAAALRADDGAAMGCVIGIADISALREAQRGRDDTMHFLSHDLRAPLASILTLAQLHGGRSAVGSVDEDFRERVERYARSALSLAENLVRLARAEGVDPECFEEVCLDMVVQDAYDETWSLARAKGVQLMCVATAHPDSIADAGDDVGTGDDEGCMVLGDADLLRRAIVNLLVNAIEHTAAGGTVLLRLIVEEDAYVVEVRDSGIGMSEAQQARLFRRYSTMAPNEKRLTGGIGLGLLMVRTVAERHHGSIAVSSQPGHGSVFTLRLPPAHGAAS